MVLCFAVLGLVVFPYFYSKIFGSHPCFKIFLLNCYFILNPLEWVKCIKAVQESLPAFIIVSNVFYKLYKISCLSDLSMYVFSVDFSTIEFCIICPFNIAFIADFYAVRIIPFDNVFAEFFIGIAD